MRSHESNPSPWVKPLNIAEIKRQSGRPQAWRDTSKRAQRRSLWSALDLTSPLHSPEMKSRRCKGFREPLWLERGASLASEEGSPRFIVELSTRHELLIYDGEHQGLLCALPGEAPWLSARLGQETLVEGRGFFHIKKVEPSAPLSWFAEPADHWSRASASEITLSGPLTLHGVSESKRLIPSLRWRLRVISIPTDIEERALQLCFTWYVSSEESHATLDHLLPNRLTLHVRGRADERIFGMGSQLTHLNLKGRAVPALVQEPGIGRGVQPLTWFMERAFGAGGSDVQSSAPSPVYLTDQGETHALEESEYALFDFTRPELRLIEIWAVQATLRVFGGAPSPRGRLRALTAFTGRMRPLPEWVHRGAIIGAQGGTSKIRALGNKLKEANVAISALWLQDWVGKRETSVGEQLWWNWALDRDHYPDWEELIADLESSDVKTLGYINPYLVDTKERTGTSQRALQREDLFSEAKRLGYLVTDPSAHSAQSHDESAPPLMAQNTSFSAAIIDLTNPHAYRWIKEVIKERLIGIGLSGWMADFGEALPMDAPLAEGEASSVHNLYPVLWARANAEAIEELGLSEEVFFFTRAGYLETPRYSRLTWFGDQLTSWRREDGIYSGLVGLLSAGLSGVSLSHSDAGGYICTAPPRSRLSVPFFTFIRSPELLMRWVEMNAFTLVLRTHEGNQPSRHHQIESDPKTLAHFARMSRLYRALAPIRRALESEAANTGAPVVAHPWLFYDQDPIVVDLATQFMLGADLMVAPALESGQEWVSLYLPQGDWGHWWTHEAVEGPAWVNVYAPLGYPVAFYRLESDCAVIAHELSQVEDQERP